MQNGSHRPPLLLAVRVHVAAHRGSSPVPDANGDARREPRPDAVLLLLRVRAARHHRGPVRGRARRPVRELLLVSFSGYFFSAENVEREKCNIY